MRVEEQEGQTSVPWSRSAAIKASASAGRYSLIPRRPTGTPCGGAGEPRPPVESTVPRGPRQRARWSGRTANHNSFGGNWLTTTGRARHRGGADRAGRVCGLTVSDRPGTLPPRSGPLSGPPLMTELGGSQITTLLETLPGIAQVLRSPVADAVVNLIRAGARLREFQLKDAEELVNFAIRRGLLGQSEGERVLAEAQAATERRQEKAAERAAGRAAKTPA